MNRQRNVQLEYEDIELLFNDLIEGGQTLMSNCGGSGSVYLYCPSGGCTEVYNGSTFYRCCGNGAHYCYTYCYFIGSCSV